MIFQVTIICFFIFIISYNGNILVKTSEAAPPKTQENTNSNPSESSPVDSRPPEPKHPEPEPQPSVSEVSNPAVTIPQPFMPGGFKLPEFKLPENQDYSSLLNLSCSELQNLQKLISNFEVEIYMLNKLIGLQKERDRLRTVLSDLIENGCASPVDEASTTKDTAVSTEASTTKDIAVSTEDFSTKDTSVSTAESSTKDTSVSTAESHTKDTAVSTSESPRKDASISTEVSPRKDAAVSTEVSARKDAAVSTEVTARKDAYSSTEDLIPVSSLSVVPEKPVNALELQQVRIQPIKSEAINTETPQPIRFQPAESQPTKTEDGFSNLRGLSPPEATPEVTVRSPTQLEIHTKTHVQGASGTSAPDESQIIDTTALSEARGLASIGAERRKSYESTDSGIYSHLSDETLSRIYLYDIDPITSYKVAIDIEGDIIDEKTKKSNELARPSTPAHFEQDESLGTPESKPEESPKVEGEVSSGPLADEVVSSLPEQKLAQSSETEEPSKSAEPALPPSDNTLEPGSDDKSQSEHDDKSVAETLPVTPSAQPEDESVTEGSSKEQQVLDQGKQEEKHEEQASVSTELVDEDLDTDSKEYENLVDEFAKLLESGPEQTPAQSDTETETKLLQDEELVTESTILLTDSSEVTLPPFDQASKPLAHSTPEEPIYQAQEVTVLARESILEPHKEPVTESEEVLPLHTEEPSEPVEKTKSEDQTESGSTYYIEDSSKSDVEAPSDATTEDTQSTLVSPSSEPTPPQLLDPTEILTLHNQVLSNLQKNLMKESQPASAPEPTTEPTKVEQQPVEQVTPPTEPTSEQTKVEQPAEQTAPPLGPKPEPEQQPAPQESKEETAKPPEETKPVEPSDASPVTQESKESAAEVATQPPSGTPAAKPAEEIKTFTLVIDATDHDATKYEVTVRDENTTEFTMKNGNKCDEVQFNGKQVWKYDSNDSNAKFPVSMKHDTKKKKVRINFGSEIEGFSTK
ncbi:hypothetical protein MACJ_002653 [Theileria orientalis]|uniref:Uncharacterized protein n=1 Tax=Theileria orientalis TaxID=68886 RepID=A0A976M6K0_THEOR|nr:hypothetical protein MACJ_002653 [Theileria orientalis]